MMYVWALLSGLLVHIGSTDPFSIEDDLELTEEVAQIAELPYIVYVHAKWCTPCRFMEESTLRDERVRALLDEHFVFCKMDADKPEGQLFMVVNELQSVPSILMYSPEGELLHQFNSAPSTDELLSALQSYGKKGS